MFQFIKYLVILYFHILCFVSCICFLDFGTYCFHFFCNSFLGIMWQMPQPEALNYINWLCYCAGDCLRCWQIWFLVRPLILFCVSDCLLRVYWQGLPLIYSSFFSFYCSGSLLSRAQMCLGAIPGNIQPSRLSCWWIQRYLIPEVLWITKLAQLVSVECSL